MIFKCNKISYRQILCQIFGFLTIVLNAVLIYTTQVPSVEQAPNRHVVYFSAVIFSNLIYNFLALFLGAKITKDDNYLGNLPKMVINYFGITILCFLAIAGYNREFTFQNIFDVILPLSRNVYPFALAVLVCSLLGTPVAKQIAKMSVKHSHAVLLLFIWLMFILPLAFNNDLWSISSGTNFIWLMMLFILGMVWQVPKSKKRFLKDLLALIVLSLAIILTVKYLPLTQDPVNLEGKIFSPYSILSFLTTLVLFDLYQQSQIKTNGLGNWLIFDAYFIVHTPIFLELIKNNIFIGNDISFLHYVFLIMRNLCLISGAVVLVFIFMQQVFKLTCTKNLLQRYAILKSDDLTDFYTVLKRLFNENKRLIIAFSVSYGVSVVQFIAVRVTVAKLNYELLEDILVNKGAKVFLTTLIYLAVFYLIYALINKYLYSLFILITGTSLISIAEYLKILMRDEPIFSSDLALISTLPEVLKMIDKNIVYLVFATIGVLFLITVLVTLKIEPKMKYTKALVIRRLKIFVGASLFLIITLFKNDANILRPVILKAVDYQNISWIAVEGARVNGPLLQFANDFIEHPVLKPIGYTKAKIKKIQQKYTKLAKEINDTRVNTLKNQTVIFILSESFSDPKRVKDLTIDHDPIPFITSLKQQTTSGLMVSSAYGGGTANIEWQTLSSMTYGNLVANAGMP